MVKSPLYASKFQHRTSVEYEKQVDRGPLYEQDTHKMGVHFAKGLNNVELNKPCATAESRYPILRILFLLILVLIDICGLCVPPIDSLGQSLIYRPLRNPDT